MSRPTNLEVRSREYLLEDEIDKLIDASKKGSNSTRDSLMILLMFRHGLRVHEAINLKWEDIDMVRGTIHVNRLKHGVSGRHPLKRIELIGIANLKRKRKLMSPYMFLSNRGVPIDVSTVQKFFKRYGDRAGFTFPVHPHMMRHSCGYYLASNGVDTRAIAEYLGHTSMNNTYRYTAISPTRFTSFFPG